MDRLITRKEAKLAGLKHYFTGKPCANGHIDIKQTSSKTCLTCHRERGAARQTADRDADLRRQLKWRSANRQKHCARSLAWQKANPAKKYLGLMRRRALKKGAAGSHTIEELSAIRDAQGDRCVYCQVPLHGKGHRDHIVALSKGGSNWASNLQWLCASCNSAKGAKDAAVFERLRRAA